MVHQHSGKASKINSQLLLFFKNHKVIFFYKEKPKELSKFNQNITDHDRQLNIR
jgi:hypothetical protein